MIAKHRKVYLDFLKIISILLVIFNHTGLKGFVLFIVAREQPLYFFYLFISILSKCAVPIFLMISGALLLGKEETYKELFTKRIFKYSIVLLIASFVSYVWMIRNNLSEFNITYFFTHLYSSDFANTYWYLYLYLSFLFMLPILRKLVKTLNNTDYIYIFIIYLAFQSLSIFEWFVGECEFTHNPYFSFFITTNYIFYPIFGYYIDSNPPYFKISITKKIVILTIASVLSISICCIITNQYCIKYNYWDEPYVQAFFNTYIFIPAFSLFYIAKHLIKNSNNFISKVITCLGSCSFGIMLIEHICREITGNIFSQLKPIIHTFPACLIWVLCSYFFGLIIVLGLKKIPIIDKYISS